jgi:hypothetical protein
MRVLLDENMSDPRLAARLRAQGLNRLQPRETSYDVRLAGSADDHAERPAVQQDEPRHDQYHAMPR